MTALRAAQVREVAPVLARVVRWQPVPVAVVASVALLWWQGARLHDAPDAVWLLRCVALLLAVACASALDDPTRSLLAAVPTPAWWRAALRVLVVLLPATLAWGVALLWAVHAAGRLPAAALSLEGAGLTAAVLAVAAGLARWRGTDDPGLVAGPVVFGLALVLLQLPERLVMVGPPGPHWAAAHQRWALLLGAAAVVLVLSLRDPAARVRRLGA